MLDRTFSEVEARAVAGWSYEPPFDLYDQDSDHPEVFLARGPAGEGYYPAIDRYGELVAFAVFGAEARVLGQQQVAGTLDVGLGVRPDMTSRGVGTELLGSVVARVGAGGGVVSRLRCAVAVFNTRSLALCRRAGFEPVRDFTGPGDRTFRELARPVVMSKSG